MSVVFGILILNSSEEQRLKMRELYACQVSLAERPEATPVRQLVEEWVARPTGLAVDDLRPADSVTLTGPNGHLVEIQSVALDAGEGWLCGWRRADDDDPTLDWRTTLAIGPALEAKDEVLFTVRIGVERRGDSFRVAPPRYSFNAPTIVRTLLREHVALDDGVRVEPRYRTRRAGDVTALANLLRSPARRLPVVVVTRAPAGEHSVDALALAHQLAGLAHVEVLTTHLAAMALTDEVGRDRSVWGGGARLYWPGPNFSDSAVRHPFWSRTRIAHQPNFTERLRSWLGTLAATAAPEHPAVRALRLQQRRRLHQEADLPPWVEEYVADLERGMDAAEANATRLANAFAEEQERAEQLSAELEEVRAQFHVVQESVTEGPSSDPPDLDALTVEEAFQLARDERSQHVVYLDDCADSAAAFYTYNNPRRLYEALTAVSEAADAWQDGSLGSGFGQFFANRGYEYSGRNPAATSRGTKHHYRRQYAGDTVTMVPHLKVDQATSPDQCLRVYWYVDEDSKVLVVGHVGRHLPD